MVDSPLQRSTQGVFGRRVVERADVVKGAQCRELTLEADGLQPLFGDVQLDGNVAADLLIGLADRCNDRFLVIDPAILAFVGEFPFPHPAGGQGGPHFLVSFRRGQAGLQDARILANDFLGAVTGGSVELRVDVLDLGQQVGDDDTARALFDRLRQAANLAIALAGGREILEDADEIADLPAAVADDGNAQPLVDQLPILVAVDDLALPLAGVEQFAPHSRVKGAVMLAGREESRIAADQFVAGITQHGAEFWIDRNDGGIGIGHQDAAGTLFEDQAGKLAFLLQLVLDARGTAQANDDDAAQDQQCQQAEADHRQRLAGIGCPLAEGGLAIDMHHHEQRVAARGAEGRHDRTAMFDLLGDAANLLFAQPAQLSTRHVRPADQITFP